MSKDKKQEIELQVPVYAYAKRVLEFVYGENLQKEKLKVDFLIAAGNLITQTQRSDKVFPTQFVHNNAIELISIKETLPERIFHFLSIYDKESLRYALGNYFNKKARDILFSTAFVFESLEKNRPKMNSVLKALELYNIEPSELDHQALYRKFWQERR